MSVNRVYHTWLERIRQLRPQEPITWLRNFAWIIAGILMSRSVHVSYIAEKLPGLPSVEHYGDAWNLVQIEAPLSRYVFYQVYVEAVLQSLTTSRPAEDTLNDAQAKFAAYEVCLETSEDEDAETRSESCVLEAGIPEWGVLWGLVE